MYEHRFEFRVKKMADILETSRSGYYEWVRVGQKTKTNIEDEYFLEVIKAEFKSTRETFGPRRLSKWLNKKGVKVGRIKVERLMRENNIVPKTVRKFKATTYSNHDYPVSPNVLNRNFNVAAQNIAWVSDITYVATGEGWLYLAAVMDLYSGKIVGWAMDSLMTQQLVCDALKQAVGRARPPRGVICHSDRGVQYASKSYRAQLKKHGFIQSMSRKGNCWDNACMESFFGTLKTELIYHESYKTRAQARLSIFDYVESFYNRIRLQERLGYNSPEDYEKLRFSA
jgi:transposase InsO family protein